MPIVGQFASLARAGSFLLPGGAFESIATVTVGSGGASSVAFSDIPSGFQNLQVRWLIPSGTTGDTNIAMRFNSDTASNYTLHELIGNGSAASAGGLANVAFARVAYWWDASGSYPFVGVLDILDYANTSKFKTLRCFAGNDGNGSGKVGLNSSVWRSTSAVTSMSLFNTGVVTTVPQHTTVALYGIRS